MAELALVLENGSASAGVGCFRESPDLPLQVTVSPRGSSLIPGDHHGAPRWSECEQTKCFLLQRETVGNLEPEECVAGLLRLL